METVLLIEEDETTRKALKRAVEKEGFSTLVASDEKEGLSLFGKNSPEIVITHLKAPYMDGMEILQTVKKISPNTEVILVTACGDYDTVILALREGAIDYLKTPIDLEQLAISLGRCKEKIRERTKIAAKSTVLLFEDDEVTREKLSRVLEKEDWNVFAAKDGEEGMNIFYENKIDVVLVDIKMPKKDGMEVLHEIKKKTKDCEVIVITGYGDESTAIQALRDGAINYIRKPVDLDQMILATQKALEKLNLNRAILYKVRELELAREVIAKITQEKELVLSVGKHAQSPTLQFARKLIDTIPVGVLVVNRDMKIIYFNQPIRRALGYDPQIIQRKLCQRFSDMKIEDVDVEKVKNSLQDVFESKGEIKTISLGEHVYLVATRTTILGKDMTTEGVIMIMTGGREKKE